MGTRTASILNLHFLYFCKRSLVVYARRTPPCRPYHWQLLIWFWVRCRKSNSTLAPVTVLRTSLLSKVLLSLVGREEVLIILSRSTCGWGSYTSYGGRSWSPRSSMVDLSRSVDQWLNLEEGSTIKYGWTFRVLGVGRRVGGRWGRS